MQYYFAPLEGVTGSEFRRAHHRWFPGVDAYYMPFLSPTQDHVFTQRELRNVLPEYNQGFRAVPQLLTKNADDFLWCAGELAAMGYDEVNLNLGCPSGTVVAKGKGSGLLGAPEALDRMLDRIFSGSPVAVSLKTILESTGSVKVLAMGSCGEEAIELYSLLKPDVLLMDIRMNGMSGIEAGEKILAGYPDARILYLTTFSDDEYIIKAVLMGAKGYILKQDFESICPALETVMNGQTVFGSDVASKLPELLTNHSSFDFDHYGIVEKEQEIIEQVAKGLSNKEIASLLYLSEGTVRNYISTILEKLSLRDRTQLAIFYYTNIQ